MGRNAKPHNRVDLRLDIGTFDRLMSFINDVNNNMTHYSTNRTEVIEILIDRCLLDYDNNLEYVRSQIIQIRNGR